MTTREIGIQMTTLTVHYARRVAAPWLGKGETLLAQTCGMSRRQGNFLHEAPAGTEVTCSKCKAQTEKPAPVKRPGPKTFGQFDWTITDLRDMAKELQIPGRSKMTGEALLAEISKRSPNIR